MTHDVLTMYADFLIAKLWRIFFGWILVVALNYVLLVNVVVVIVISVFCLSCCTPGIKMIKKLNKKKLNSKSK